MTRLKVLYLLHNHPALAPGGSEAYTMRLYDALRSSDEIEPMLVARAARGNHESGGAAFGQVAEDPNQLLFFVEEDQYDKFFMRTSDKSLLTRQLEPFLLANRPDVVHVQHLLHLGADVISAIRRTLPETPIVFTLHEYLPICNHYGQLLRTNGRELCLEASPRRCNECFPEFSPQAFFLRERFLRAHFSHVDLFIAPSKFLLERYVKWGIPRHKIRFERNGSSPEASRESAPRDMRNRFAFFGVMTPFKGADVLLSAMARLGSDFDGHLWVRGASYEDQPEALRNELQALLSATTSTVTFSGPYDRADMPSLMADIDWVVVPSIWWENSPLVITEAFQHSRPVICSGIGGMAEMVENEVSGLHFKSGDAESLAATMRRAVEAPGLWDRLRAGIPTVYSMADHLSTLTDIYRELVAGRRAQNHNRSLGVGEAV